jgi:hypothetical protein
MCWPVWHNISNYFSWLGGSNSWDNLRLQSVGQDFVRPLEYFLEYLKPSMKTQYSCICIICNITIAAFRETTEHSYHHSNAFQYSCAGQTFWQFSVDVYLVVPNTFFRNNVLQEQGVFHWHACLSLFLLEQTTAICVKPKAAGGAPEDGAAGGDAGDYENTVDTTE